MTSRWLPLVALVGVCAACSGAPESPGALVLSPEHEALALTERAVEVWDEAAGLWAPVGPGGIPVRIADEVIGANGRSTCGLTRARVDAAGALLGIDEVLLRRDRTGCSSLFGGLMHELGHVYCNWGSGAVPECHSADGLMAAHYDGASMPDEASVAAVCAEAGC